MERSSSWLAVSIGCSPAVLVAIPILCLPKRSDPLDDHCDALPDADAHRAERVTTACTMQLIDGRRHETGPAHAERMPHRNRAPIRVHVRRVIRQAKVAEDGERLRGKC